MSNSFWPHGLYSPWNSPGQTTGVGKPTLFRGSSQPRDWTQVSLGSRIAGGFYQLSHKGSPNQMSGSCKNSSVTCIISHKEPVIPGEQVWVSHLRNSPYGKCLNFFASGPHISISLYCSLCLLHTRSTESFFGSWFSHLPVILAVILPERHLEMFNSTHSSISTKMQLSPWDVELAFSSSPQHKPWWPQNTWLPLPSHANINSVNWNWNSI